MLSNLRTKRWDDPREPDDGYRLLICRYRPRGVKREDETLDAWCEALAPSADLHAARYGKAGAPLAWPEYEVRFRREMERQGYWLNGFAARLRAGERMTLLCSSACIDSALCHRTLVAELLGRFAFPPALQAAGAGAVGRVIVRRRPSG